ncbi:MULTISPECIES: hypothetical protein [unclassified Leisingera]|uniref:hypothetical protein n=1 Tax=unclassified Leisingera TaxID=2614906 RepID=UPI0021A82D79|nr:MULTISPECIES: hypothetical protein [unclassified Leisingera]UWQ27731.1 hypothetical protein K3557_13090 [Leisingera sp. M523]UWQ75776.1 hypothetical protein K3724_04790 [Leisingera sp. M658]
MGLKKAMGILVFSTQAVIGYDYYIQTRAAGLNWGDLSATDYSTILQDRFTRARAAKEATSLAGLAAGDGQSIWSEAAGYGKSLLSGGQQVADAQSNEDAPQPVCIRRGNVADC